MSDAPPATVNTEASAAARRSCRNGSTFTVPSRGTLRPARQASAFDPPSPTGAPRLRHRCGERECASRWLGGCHAGGVDVRRGGIQAAIASMRKATTPSVLIVDISDEESAAGALARLADVVEPDVCVLVVGGVDSVDFFHEVTATLARRITCRSRSRPTISGASFRRACCWPRSGRRGCTRWWPRDRHRSGWRVGATTLAVNLAGYFGVTLHRHTVILDPESPSRRCVDAAQLSSRGRGF